MRNAAAGNHAVGNGYAPSVPISVYRELAAELQATRAMLDSLNSQNQQLTQQNQQLRAEVEKVVQSALQLQKVAGLPHPVRAAIVKDIPTIHPDILDEPIYAIPTSRPIPRSAPPRLEAPEPPIISEKLIIEQEEPRSRRSPQSERGGSGLDGFWLGVVIFLIVVSAFGAGFVIVRPFLPSR